MPSEHAVQGIFLDHRLQLSDYQSKYQEIETPEKPASQAPKCDESGEIRDELVDQLHFGTIPRLESSSQPEWGTIDLLK
jgi:hypothetical protein